jgi:hypothetical protein
MPMKKFTGRPEDIVSELVAGLVLLQPERVRLAGSKPVARTRNQASGTDEAEAILTGATHA